MGTRLLPGDGAFIIESDVSLGATLADMKAHLGAMLVPLETYRASTRKVKRREGLISDIYVELPDGLTTPRLARLDAFALELIATVSCETSRTAHAPKRILRLLVVVDGWDA
jgi:hypothetical protein